MATQSTTSFPGFSLLRRRVKTLVGAGHVPPTFWVVNLKSTVGGVAEYYCNV